MTVRLGYNGDPEAKSKIIKRMQKHVEADELVRGVYLEKGRGCSVTCIVMENLRDLKVIFSSDTNSVRTLYEETEKLLNIPGIAVCIDNIHETTDLKENFSIQLLEEIQIDVDYSNFAQDIYDNARKKYNRTSIYNYPKINIPEDIDYKEFFGSEQDTNWFTKNLKWKTHQSFRYHMGVLIKAAFIKDTIKDLPPPNNHMIEKNSSRKFLRYLRNYNKKHKVNISSTTD